MKIILLFFLTVLFTEQIFSQKLPEDYVNSYHEIIAYIQENNNYVALNNIEIFLAKYPNDAGMFFNRGLVKFRINDIAAAENLLEAKRLGLKGHDGFINELTSKSYMANILTKGYLKIYDLKPENDFKPVFTYKDSLRGALRPERTCYDVYFYDLTVKILPDSKSITGENKIFFKTTSPTGKIQIDLWDNYKIASIAKNGKELKYQRVYNALFITFDPPLSAGENDTVIIKYSGSPLIAPTPPWDGGFVWKKSKRKWWIGVACEHLGASCWWPCKDHLSDKPDSMRINVRVPEGYNAVANGNLRSVKNIEDHYVNFEWFVSYPINSYCVTFYMGKFVNFNETYTNTNGSYSIDYYVLKQHLNKARKFYSKTHDIVKVYEDLYGEYAFKKDGLAFVEAPYEGMENQSAIAIGGDYGKTKRRSYEKTDYDYLVVHETAHEWWGNAVTMKDMADAWLSEGFATYSELLFIEKKYGYEAYLSACSENMLRIFNIWPVVGVRDVNDNSFLGNDIYHKGATILNNLRCLINDDDLFFSVIKKFFNQNKFKTLTTTDFTDFVNHETGHDYTDFFNKFLYDADPPVLRYSFELKADTLTFKYNWENTGDNFSMPFSITINDEKNFRLMATTTTQTFVQTGVKSFYLPNEKRFEPSKMTRNSFTYYKTSWEK